MRSKSTCTTWMTFFVIITSVFSADKESSNEKQEIPSPQESQSQIEVVVVGGGIAGMAAARKLTNDHRFSVKVLEACVDRYGGRIWTDRKQQSGIRGIEKDLGAMWINSGVKNNPLLEWAEYLELEIKTAGQLQLHVPSQNKIFSQDEANKIFSELLTVTQKAVEKTNKLGKDRPLTEAIQEELSSFETKTDKSILKGLLSSHYSLSVDDFSALMFRPEKDFGWDKTIVDGFDQIIDGIVSGNGTEFPIEIELQTIVRQIDFDKKTQKYKVRTADLQQHTADVVIIAVPLGVLKKNNIIFGDLQKNSSVSKANLPSSWYTTVQDKLGVSPSNKLIIEFDEVFWQKDVGVFTMVPDDPADAGFLQTWVNLHYFVSKPMLMGFLLGPAAEQFEKMKDEELKVKAKQLLSKLFGEVALEHKIKSVQRSAWQKDPNILGVNSYPRVGTTADDLKILAEPRCPGIYFAGEYTNIEHMNTAHGAYMSGVRAADQVLSGYCQEQEKKRKAAKKEKKKKKSKTKSDNKIDDETDNETDDTDTEEDTKKKKEPKIGKKKEKIILSEERRAKVKKDEL